jgi:hypothetical protein
MGTAQGAPVRGGRGRSPSGKLHPVRLARTATTRFHYHGSQCAVSWFARCWKNTLLPPLVTSRRVVVLPYGSAFQT